MKEGVIDVYAFGDKEPTVRVTESFAKKMPDPRGGVRQGSEAWLTRNTGRASWGSWVLRTLSVGGTGFVTSA